jgi:hypothetical protein
VDTEGCSKLQTRRKGPLSPMAMPTSACMRAGGVVDAVAHRRHSGPAGLPLYRTMSAFPSGSASAYFVDASARRDDSGGGSALKLVA